MRVTFNRSEGSTGLIFKKKTVDVMVTVVFTEEEKAILNKLGFGKKFGDYPLWEGEVGHGLTTMLDVSNFIKKPTLNNPIRFDNVIEAGAFEQHMRDELTQLKKIIDAGGQKTTKTDTFEL